MKRPMVLLLNLSGFGCHSTSKMAAQSYSKGINQKQCVLLFRYSDWLSRYRHSYLACCVNVKISKFQIHIYIYIYISNIQISRHALVCNYSLNVLAKFDENWSNLYTL